MSDRSHCIGGLIPTAGECNAETAGDVRPVTYTANYYFWKAKDA